MAVVQGIREKVHLPVYDSLSIAPRKQLRDEESTSVIKFFVDVQRKTKLETNLQSASLLPHYNTFEARAMRVVISDLPPQFPDDTKGTEEELPVTDEEGLAIDSNGKVEGETGFKEDLIVTANIEFGLDRLMQLLHDARENEERETIADIRDEGVRLRAGGNDLTDTEIDNVEEAGGAVDFTVEDLEAIIEALERDAPPVEQIRPNDSAGNLINKIIFNTVTTLYVGEKIMIQMPTWFFPGGAGAYSEGAKFLSHGEPSPLATFRFAEPIFIDKQQNFRVEIEVPDKDVLDELQKIYGPFNIWVVLDGYMMRDVQ